MIHLWWKCTKGKEAESYFFFLGNFGLRRMRSQAQKTRPQVETLSEGDITALVHPEGG